MRRFVFATFAVTVLAACQPTTTELTEEQKAAIGDSVTTVHNDMWQTWMAKDMDGTMSFFVNSPDIGYGSPSGMYFGSEKITAFLQPFLNGTPRVDFPADQRRVDVLSWDVVCVRESGTYSTIDTAGATSQGVEYAVTTIYVRHYGEWKILHMHDSWITRQSGE